MPVPALRAARACAILAVAAAALLGLTACVADAAPTNGANPTADASPTPAPSSTPTPSTDPRATAPAAARVAPTCDNILDPASGTTVGEVVLPDGAAATPTVPVLAQGPNCATDGGTGDFYAWSPASRSDWDALVAEFTADSAWFAEDGPRGTYLTYEIDVRYGQTFLFTGDAVILAPTKAATDVVIGPPIA
ncbi:hypothetical protein [Microbacterium trichothecenolyticum]|uniref:Uncharacterized protein n=1 Tax=Microbacterium trichothecenolyticum TaxID=69370 RepID=A0ABU0TXJ2_MICTR|nr:hypothetical protein [Microbacterium trichothecenolyticum]MDQ1124366.1 hypothetical protein [Microbacterium trichothecenolyticum]